MTQPSPFCGTEDFFRACVSDAVETLRFPLCPTVRLRTERELEIYMEALRGLEAAKEQDAKDWAPIGAKESKEE